MTQMTVNKNEARLPLEHIIFTTPTDEPGCAEDLIGPWKFVVTAMRVELDVFDKSHGSLIYNFFVAEQLEVGKRAHRISYTTTLRACRRNVT